MKALILPGIAPLMREPESDCMIDEALCGMTVEVLEERRGWSLVRTGYRYEGWIRSCQLCAAFGLEGSWNPQRLSVVLQPWADLLCEPNARSKRLESVPRGALVQPLEPAENGWRHVALSGGRAGYLPAHFLGDCKTDWHLEEPDSLRRALVKAALAYQGVQYRWGGKTPLGIDCSGLCSMAYLLQGIVIYRDAQLRPGFPLHEIPVHDCAPGDLLFFPGHVAMYIGAGRYIHSTVYADSYGVVLNSLDPAAPDYRPDLPPLLTAVGSIF